MLCKLIAVKTFYSSVLWRLFTFYSGFPSLSILFMLSVNQQSIKKKKSGSFITILSQGFEGYQLWEKKKIYIYIFRSNLKTAHFKPLLYNTSVSTIKLWPCSHDNTDFAEFLPIVLRKTPRFKADDERQDSQKTTLLSKTCKEHWWEEGAFLVTDRPEQQ